jgi:hypothetical protein
MTKMTKYLVRQYRPGYFTGFPTSVISGVEEDDITKVPFCENFKHSGFTKFTVEPYSGELIISAHYENGKSWVVGFALPEESTLVAPDGGLMRDNWRYRDGHVF